MINISKSPTADTRTCDVTKVSKQQLLQSSEQHIQDVQEGIQYFIERLTIAASGHDVDKIVDINGFYRDFKVKFETTEWWDNYRRITRHHLNYEDGVPNSVNLIDILEYITDCVMAGMARSGSVYELKMTPEMLMTAFANTVDLLKDQVKVNGSADSKE
jgi:hypothetical protein